MSKSANSIFSLQLALFLCISCSDDSTPPPTPTIELGDFLQGGVVFYLDGSGEHGLICSIEDQSFNADWGCPNLVIDGADDTAVGTGAQNTLDIIQQCTESGIAALLCSDYEFDSYSDWFLPSIDELSLVEQNKEIISQVSVEQGGQALEDTEYWSSSESTTNTVFVENLSDGGPFAEFKEGNTANVRAIREF